MILETIAEHETREVGAPVQAPTCGTCGELSAPDGTCLEIGACERADLAATRGASGRTAKFAVPAAWNARGAVD